MTTVPPRTDPVPRTVNGSAPRPSSSISTPSARSAVSTSPIGRLRMCGSPSNGDRARRTAPATGGTNRITVPASPQSTSASPANAAGVTVQSSPLVSTVAPSAVSAVAISGCRATAAARRTTEGPSASAARTSARLVSDLLPGSVTTACTGASARGAGQGSAVRVVVTRKGYRRSRSARSGPLRAWPRAGRRGRGAWPRGARPSRPGGPARPRPACPRCRPPASSSPPRAPRFLKKCSCWFFRWAGSDSSQNRWPANVVGTSDAASVAEASPRRPAGGERGRGGELDGRVDPDQRDRVLGERRGRREALDHRDQRVGHARRLAGELGGVLERGGAADDEHRRRSSAGRSVW